MRHEILTSLCLHYPVSGVSEIVCVLGVCVGVCVRERERERKRESKSKGPPRPLIFITEFVHDNNIIN